jgi:CheY-like chemotaxis protein
MVNAGRILVVEDDALLRLGACAVLQEAGYDILEARDADEAITMLESEPGIGVVVSDIQMPGAVDGLELAHAVRRRWPPIGMVLTSGRRVPAADELPHGVRYLAKPFAGAELLAEVARLASARERH